MARVPYVEPEHASPVAKSMYDKVQGRFQMLLNIGKVMGHAPELMAPFMDFIMEILKDGRVDWPTKELLILRATRLNECHYGVVQHETLSKRRASRKKRSLISPGTDIRRAPAFPRQRKRSANSLTKYGMTRIA